MEFFSPPKWLADVNAVIILRVPRKKWEFFYYICQGRHEPVLLLRTIHTFYISVRQPQRKTEKTHVEYTTYLFGVQWHTQADTWKAKDWGNNLC